MKKQWFHELIIVILVIGFAITIIQNQMILNPSEPVQELTDEQAVAQRLMSLPEMQEFQGYEGAMEYLTAEQVQQLAEEFPDIYGGINKDIYRVQLVGEKNIIVLYDDYTQTIINMFELMSAEVGE